MLKRNETCKLVIQGCFKGQFLNENIALTFNIKSEVDTLAKMQLKFPLISSSRSSAFEQTSDKDSNSWCASFQIKSSLDFILDAIMAYSLSNHKVRGVFIHWTAEAE